jgi:hypothetical protein
MYGTNSPMNDCNCSPLGDQAGVDALKALNKSGTLTTFEKLTNNPVPLFAGLVLGGATTFFATKFLKPKRGRK